LTQLAGFAQQTIAVGSAASCMKATLASAAEASSAAADSVNAAAGMSSDAADAYVKACAPVADGLTAASALLFEKNTEAATTITSFCEWLAASLTESHAVSAITDVGCDVLSVSLALFRVPQACCMSLIVYGLA
jgi:hypothetical protein